MAVTAEDKKFLNEAGIAALQQATLDWESANQRGDQAGMKAASSYAASIRADSRYQLSGGAGYVTDSWGRYTEPVQNSSSSNSNKTSGSSSSGKTTSGSSGDPYSNRDIAAEIVSLLTSGGPIDYAKLNMLAAERDAKINSNPSAYGQFESTQDILNRYLPLAQENQSLKQQQSYQTPMEDIPIMGGESDVDAVIALINALVGTPNSYLSWDEAQQRAGSELNPMYQQAATQLGSALDLDMERRGIYNSPLASGIMTEKMGMLTNEQVAAIASRANQLIQNDQELTLQEKQLQSNTLNALLSSLIGREANIADLTGYYGGSATLARQQYQSDLALKEGELLGTYKGQQTLASQAFDVQKSSQLLANALNTVQTMGKVTTQEQANILGVPIGTSSWQAAEAAAQREQDLMMFNTEMNLKRASLSASSAANNAQNMLAAFTKDMTIWETTGKAPDTDAMRYYGIAPGTPWKEDSGTKLQDAQNKLNQMYVDEELAMQDRASNFMRTYGVSRDVALSSLLIIDQNDTYNTAKSQLNSQSSNLNAQGVNPSSVDNVLKRYYNFTDTAKTGVFGGWGPTTTGYGWSIGNY